MPTERAIELADVLKALGDPTRVRIVVAHHTGKLREAGLVIIEALG